ncbi:hypothetical protein SH139x_003782 [Planctomycetaceae bacterium SH139]
MSKKQDTPIERLKNVALWQWGLLLIIAGVLANVAMGLQASPAGSAAARGEAVGRAVFTLLAVMAGVVLIAINFVRQKRR